MKTLQNSTAHQGLTNVSWNIRWWRNPLLWMVLGAMLSGCVPYMDKGVWETCPLFGDEVCSRTVDNEGNTTIHRGTRTDLITVRLTVEVMPNIAEPCAEWPNATACKTDKVYIQGEPQRVTMLMNIQFTEWGDKPRYEAGTLYTYAYPTIGHSYEMGLVGDLLAEALDLDIGFNRRTSLGHEVMAHVAGLEHPFISPWSVNDGLR